MNTIRKTLLVGMAVLSLGAVGNAARAEDAPAQGRHGQALSQEQRAAKMAEHKAKFSEHVAKRQAKLHDALKLSAAQEPAWTAFVAATTPQLRGARPDRAALAQLSAPERMEKRLELHKQMLARQETRLAAVKTF
jgi:protein CpxP